MLFDAGKPVLGICRGHQLINVALGGTLHQDESQVDGAHAHSNLDVYDDNFHMIEIDPASSLATLYPASTWRASTPFTISRSRRWAGPEGGSALEGRRCDRGGARPTGAGIAGVQWHPEFIEPDHPHHSDLLPGEPILEDFSPPAVPTGTLNMSATLTITNPANGRLLERLPADDARSVKAKYNAARARNNWNGPYRFRESWPAIRRFRARLLEEREELAVVLSSEMGKARHPGAQRDQRPHRAHRFFPLPKRAAR